MSDEEDEKPVSDSDGEEVPSRPGRDDATADLPSVGQQRFERLLRQSSVRVGDTVGPYRLTGPIGSGSFGEVWRAERREPYRQVVAIKFLRDAHQSESVIARFDQERQALALMDHPSVAKVYDGGMTESGRPYFVMEFVAGEPITAYCDRVRLTIAGRLRLFVQVCEAVQHAHTKMIIHRDLKPSNVLVVADGDSAPIAKVIDFGVAKAMDRPVAGKEAFTEFGQMLGTPEYMSPEQAEIGAVDIDTRSDVYSLGVMLYELLVGMLPFEPGELRSKAYREIQRIIREVDPPAPSTRLSSVEPSERPWAAGLAERRQMAVDALAATLRRELEWIPLKAMRKQREERYTSPLAMALDIRNYLEGRPIDAAPESAWYRLRKFTRRHRGQVAAAVAVLVALLLGLTTTIWQWREAEHSLREAEAMNDFVVNDLFGGSDVDRYDEQTRAADIVRRAAQLVPDRFPGGSRSRARLRGALGTALLGVGSPGEAVPPLESALEEGSGLSWRESSLLRLALSEAFFRNIGGHQDAGARSRELAERVLSDLDAQGQAGDREDELLRGNALNHLGGALKAGGELEAALEAYAKSLEIRLRLLPREAKEVYVTRGNMALVRQLEALKRDRQLRRDLEPSPTLDREQVMKELRSVISLYGASAREFAELHAQTAADLGEGDMQTISMAYEAAVCELRAARLARACGASEESVAPLERALPALEAVHATVAVALHPRHMRRVWVATSYALALAEHGRVPEAIPVLEPLFVSEAALPGTLTTDVIRAAERLAHCLEHPQVGRGADAVRHMERVIGELRVRTERADLRDQLLASLKSLAESAADRGDVHAERAWRGLSDMTLGR